MFACKDVSVVRGRGDSDVVRPVVAPVVLGTHQGWELVAIGPRMALCAEQQDV